MNRQLFSIFLVCCLIMTSTYAAQSWQGIRNDQGMLLYSNMGFIEEEGEYSGLEVAIIFYNPQYGSFQYKVLWRSGSGYLDTPLLLNAVVQQDSTLKITVPRGYDEAGEWILTIAENSLFAKGPLGHSYELKKVAFR